MQSMTNKELQEIQGGGINWGMMAGIGAFASFLIGIIDGVINPKKCNN
ncbi:MAG: class IIb bacteriocin, lactobin A/cerein 7B family [Erysipelotrichaceae bacterium]|nr:class IIb bacteriocin, lactobin A/cerein 7B family [Erysipelotrichaceae bacterium]